jgi:hypothetical protein
MNILHHAAALEALHDSADSFLQPRCHPETRTRMLDDLYDWVTSVDSVEPICWLRGLAGGGKSAIMQTLCERVQSADRLGGAFIFKRGHTTRGNAKAFFATLAYQLALNNRHIKPMISLTANHDPSVVGGHMGVQLRKPIVELCHSLPNSPPVIILIDGLDECDTPGAQVEILRLIGSAVRQHPNTLRFLIASRPDIRGALEEPSFSEILKSVDVEAFDAVPTYFRDESRVHREHRATIANIPTSWPSPEILNELFEKSSGLFVWACTAINYINDKNFRPTDRLTNVNLTPTVSVAGLETLDQLYSQILAHSNSWAALDQPAHGSTSRRTIASFLHPPSPRSASASRSSCGSPSTRRSRTGSRAVVIV